MGTKTFNNYEDLLTFTRASKGHALRPVSYGDEQVVNGDFATDSDWTKGTGWAISSGTATHTGGVYGALQQDLNTTIGSVFILTADITYISGGGIQLQVNGVGPSAYTSTQSISYAFVAVGTDTISFGAGSGDWTIDNVSIKEVLFDQPDGTLTLFEHPNNVPRVEWLVNTEKTKFKNISSEILRAAGTQEPQATEFNVLVNGQKIGDITNNGTVSAFDASMYISWFEGSLTNQTYIDYIENILNPYIETNLSKYLVDAPVGRQRAGLLVEEARTNLLPYSDFSLGWADAATDVLTLNAGTAPDKTNTATEFNCASGGFLYDAITVTASTKYTFSWYAKAGTATAHVFAFYDESNSAFVQQQAYTLTGGEYVGNGWYRISRTVTTPAGCTSIRVYPLRANDGGGGVSGAIGTTLIWGAQFEEGSFATSYIKTTGATATRSADLASIPVADFGYNHKEGTIFAEFSGKFNEGGTLFPRPYELSGGNSSSDRVTVYFAESNGNLAAEVRNGNVQSAGLVLQTGVSSDFTAIKTAFAFKADDFAATEDGDTPVTDTAGSFTPSTPRDELALMGTVTGGQTLNGHIKSIKYYPRRLTNAQLQEITS